jgi:transposase
MLLKQSLVTSMPYRQIASYLHESVGSNLILENKIIHKINCLAYKCSLMVGYSILSWQILNISHLCKETRERKLRSLNPFNAELNPICHLLALLGAHPILHVSRIGVNTMAVIND